MSQPNLESVSAPSVLNKKSAWNIYTSLLVISLVALMIGCLMLYLEINNFGGFGSIKGPLN